MEDVNRIKLVLVEKKRTNKWLSDQMGVTPSTVSKWCTNSSQPDLPSLLKIADLLEVDSFFPNLCHDLTYPSCTFAKKLDFIWQTMIEGKA